MISNVLVANRSEIARRVFATARRMGLGTTAVYTDPDACALHVTDADAAVRLPGSSPAETYLNAQAIIQAARLAGADAVHPGYGFLSENADFAAQVLEAGLTWIGPTPAAISEMGSKIEAKKIMAACGVPVLAELDPDAVTAGDLPVLIKASAGGGGRGMRVVQRLDDLPAELDAARREAGGAFGDPTVFCERYLPNGRHIEVQVMADLHGTVWAVGERECSIQRRHQKVVEEAPSPLVERVEGMRLRLFDAARRAATAIGYVGAGTVEFLAEENGEFFFLEMNTRLQVEHPVTEQTTGLDLVRLQLEIADGQRLGPEPPPIRGHAIEVRLYAENPAEDWQPQSGTLEDFEVPGASLDFSVLQQPGVRLDSGVGEHTTVSVYYDPMLAKLISWAEGRREAATVLASSLRRSRIHGLVTNRDLLVRVLEHPAFLAGETDTAFFQRHGLDTLAAPLADREATQLSAVAAALADSANNRRRAVVNPSVPAGWRSVYSQPQTKSYLSEQGEEVAVAYRTGRAGPVVEGPVAAAVVEATPDSVTLGLPPGNPLVRRRFAVARYGDLVCVDSPSGAVALRRVPRFSDPADRMAPGSLLAPMPGVVVRVGATVGDEVTHGQPILWLEAMKMEHPIVAPADGVLRVLNVAVGQQVELGAELAVVEDPDLEPAEPGSV